MMEKTQELSRKERERLFRRQEIVNAAREVFALRGFTAATLDDIAERAEFGKGTLYSYFESKEELFDTVMSDILDEFVDIAVSSFSITGKGLEESYLDFARAILAHLFDNYGIYHLLMREMHRTRQQSHLATILPDFFLILREPLRRALPEDIDDHFTGQLGFLFFTMILSLFRSSLHLLGQLHCSDETAELQLTPEEVSASIDRCITLLRQAYFNGVLSMTKEGK